MKILAAVVIIAVIIRLIYILGYGIGHQDAEAKIDKHPPETTRSLP